MKKSHALAHLQHLSCLGLGGEMVIPHMLATLHDIVPSDANTFAWTDDDGHPINMYAPSVAASTLDFMVNAYHLFQRPGELAIETVANGPLQTGNMLRWQATGQLDRTLAYNEVFLPNGAARILDLVLRQGPRPRGLVMVNRGSRDRPFSTAEQRTLGELAPYFLHALEAAPSPVAPGVARKDTGALADTGEQGVLLCDGTGRVLALGPGAGRMLMYATHARIAPGADGGGTLDTIPPIASRLCRDLRAIQSGRPASPPIARILSPWGTFVFQAHPLSTTSSGQGDGLISVVIRREEARELRIMARLKNLPLSPRHRQLALLIGLGRLPDAAQAELHISRATYRTYVARIYNQLGVHSRTGLVAALSV